MQVAQVLAGYSLGEADLLRRAMGKKDAGEMAKQKGRFVAGAVERGHDQPKTEELFDLLAKFAEYGFNKSHSAAYGYVAYQTAWLKAHHRAEYMAALMTIDAGDSDKILVYINDCRKAGLLILPPDVHHSQRAFDVPAANRRSIRYGLAAVKGLGEGAIAAIVEAREDAGGTFKDFLDFLTRVDPRRVNKKALESLLKCGALDGFGEPRARLFAALEGAMAAAAQELAQKASGQTSLFGGGMAGGPKFRMPTTPEWPIAQRMKNEKEALGLFITGHPMADYAAEVGRWATCTLGEAERLDSGAEVKLAGMIAAVRVIRTKKGDKMAFVTLEDESGSLEAVFFSDAYQKAQALLTGDRPLMVSGKVERREGSLSLRADTVERLEDLREKRTRRITVRLAESDLVPENLDQMQALFKESQGACAARVEVVRPEWTATYLLDPSWRVAATPRLVDGLRGLFGTDSVRLEA